MIRWLLAVTWFFLVTYSTIAQGLIKPEGKAQKISLADTYIMRPSWSPLGHQLAFTGAHHTGIWIYDFNSKEIFQLVDKAGAGFHFAWSPDGRFLAFRARYTENRRSTMTIEIAEVSTRKITVLTTPEKHLGLPQWGPDNSKLFFTKREKLHALATGIPVTKSLTKGFAASRKELVFTSFGRLQRSFYDQPDSVENPFPKLEVINPVVSPDGRYVACEEYGGGLMLLDLHNRERVPLGAGHRPCWSPDGNWIAFMVTEDDGHQYLASDIYLTNLHGKKRVKLTDTEAILEMNPGWSPDGTAIAYDDFKTGVIYIQRVKLE